MGPKYGSQQESPPLFSSTHLFNVHFPGSTARNFNLYICDLQGAHLCSKCAVNAKRKLAMGNFCQKGLLSLKCSSFWKADLLCYVYR